MRRRWNQKKNQEFSQLVQVSEERLSEKCADASVKNVTSGSEENKGDDDTISISSQKINTFNTLKSYANILSGGIKKVGNVFKPKPKEENKKEKVSKVIDPVILLPAETESAVEESIKPDIPGLVFKEMERRPSKKKRKSRPSFIESELTQVEDVSSVNESAKRLESKIFEIMTTTDKEKETTPVKENTVDSHKTTESQENRDKSRENTFKRKNSKKKKSQNSDTKHFADEIDQALHEIKLIEEQEKNKE